MWSPVVIVPQIASESLPGVSRGGIGVGIDLLILDRAPPPPVRATAADNRDSTG
jgi:hypothetical protein